MQTFETVTSFFKKDPSSCCTEYEVRASGAGGQIGDYGNKPAESHRWLRPQGVWPQWKCTLSQCIFKLKPKGLVQGVKVRG